MATLASGLSARLWPGGTYTRWIPSRSFTVSSSVPPLPSFSQRDDNVGGVKHISSVLVRALVPSGSCGPTVSSAFWRTLLYALREERPFRSISWFALFQPGLALNRQGQELSPTQPSLRSRTAIKIPFIRTPSPTGSGMPNHYVGDLLRIPVPGILSAWLRQSTGRYNLLLRSAAANEMRVPACPLSTSVIC